MLRGLLHDVNFKQKNDQSSTELSRFNRFLYPYAKHFPNKNNWPDLTYLTFTTLNMNMVFCMFAFFYYITTSCFVAGS